MLTLTGVVDGDAGVGGNGEVVVDIPSNYIIKSRSRRWQNQRQKDKSTLFFIFNLLPCTMYYDDVLYYMWDHQSREAKINNFYNNLCCH